ncbi:hypothetical protein GBA52_001135 [Prunus armeniaca]|nr:hypothetical protein GBA52_001135 [Prunus armeniaca]
MNQNKGRSGSGSCRLIIFTNSCVISTFYFAWVSLYPLPSSWLWVAGPFLARKLFNAYPPYPALRNALGFVKVPSV